MAQGVGVVQGTYQLPIAGVVRVQRRQAASLAQPPQLPTRGDSPGRSGEGAARATAHAAHGVVRAPAMGGTVQPALGLVFLKSPRPSTRSSAS